MRKTPSKEIVELLDKWKTFERKLRTIGSVFNFIFLIALILFGIYYLFP